MPRSERSPLTLGLLAVLGSAVAFTISLSVVKWPGVAGSAIAWWRLVGSAALWWAFLMIRRRRTGRPLPDRAAWRAAVPPALCFGINISIFFLALTRTSVAHADFIASMAPLVLIPAGFVFFGERPRWRALGWGVLSVAGLVIILTACLSIYGATAFQTPDVVGVKTLSGRDIARDPVQSEEGWAKFTSGWLVGGLSGVAWSYFLTQVLPYYS